MSEEELEIVSTKEAARMLNRKPQTLRLYSHRGDGPLKPIKIHGRLGWKLSQIKQLLRGEKVE